MVVQDHLRDLALVLTGCEPLVALLHIRNRLEIERSVHDKVVVAHTPQGGVVCVVGSLLGDSEGCHFKYEGCAPVEVWLKYQVLDWMGASEVQRVVFEMCLLHHVLTRVLYVLCVTRVLHVLCTKQL